MNNLISEFFDDGICRVIPGIVVIALYMQTEVANAFAVYGKTGDFVILSVCILVVAWFIGVMLQTIGFDIPAFLIIKLCPPSKLQKCLLPDKKSEDPSGQERRALIKSGAEIVLFRSMAIISLFSILVPPRSLSPTFTSIFTSFAWHRWYSVLSFVICAVVYGFRKWHNSRSKLAKENNA